MKNLFKKFGLFIGILLGAFAIALFVIAAFFEDEVGALFVKELNKSLKTKLEVSDINLSLISDFPSATIQLKGVKLPGAIKGSGMLLEAKEMELEFGTMSIFSQRYRVNEINISDGALFAYFDKNGNSSVDVLKSSISNKNDKDSDFSIVLETATLNDIEVIYVNELKKTEIATKVDYAEIDGEFSSNHFIINSYADIYSGFVDTPEGRFLAGTNLGYTAKIDANLKTDQYKFEEVVLEIEDNSFKVEGNVDVKDKYSNLNLRLKSKDCSLNSVIEVLPPSYKKMLGDFDSQGTFYLDADVKGKYSVSKTPNVVAKFGLKNGKINSPRLDYPIKGVTFNAQFTNGKNGRKEDAVFEINDFEGKLQSELLRLKMKVRDLSNPYVNFNFSGKLSLEAIYGVLGDNISDGAGVLDFNNLNISGYSKNMRDPNLAYKMDATGSVGLEDVMLKVKGEKISINKGLLSISNNDFKISQLNVTGADSDITLDGTAKNLVPVMLSDSINSKDAKLIFDVSLTAKQINFKELFALSDLYSKEDSDQKETEEKGEPFTNFLDGNFYSKIDQFSFGEIEGEDFRGKVAIKNNTLVIRGVRVDAMDGILNLDGKAYLEKEPRLEAIIKCHKINAKEAFRQCNNFSQTVIEHKHIDGDLDAKVLVNAFWNENGEFDFKKLYVLADVTMQNGELRGLDLLDEYSNFIKLKDLKHIKFSKTRNQFGIKRGTFYMPTMFVQSNALNLSLSGSHSLLTDKMLYLTKVNAGQVLLNKFKKYNPKKKPIKSRKKGFFNIYVKVFGKSDDYEYEYSKKSYKKEKARLDNHFAAIRRDIRKKLGAEALYEPEDWEESGTKSTKREAPVEKNQKEKMPPVPIEEDEPEVPKEAPKPEKVLDKIDEKLEKILKVKPPVEKPVEEVPIEEIPDEDYDPDLDEEID